MKTTNVLSTVGRPQTTVRLPRLNMDVLTKEFSPRGRPFGRKNSTEVVRTAGRPTREERASVSCSLASNRRLSRPRHNAN